MSLADLEILLKRPAQPEEAPDEKTLADAEQQLGTTLPEDYKDFIRSFGTGTINEFLMILNPASPNNNVNLLSRSEKEIEVYKTLKQAHPDYYQHAVFPDSGGLLPFGSTDNGEVLYWKTAPEPSGWTIVVYEARGPKYFAFNGDMTAFLTGLLGNEFECDILPKRFVQRSTTFTPINTSRLSRRRS